MMYLWGSQDAWTISSIFREKIIAAGMFCSYGIHRVTLEEYRKSGVVKHVEILNSMDSSVCKECKKIASKKYALSDVPELPHENCTNEEGCRCTIVAKV
jgi:hypothetical protein